MIEVKEAAALKDYLCQEIQCPAPLHVSTERLSDFLSISNDRQPMHEAGEGAVVPANLLLTLLPAVLQSGIRVGRFSRCFTVAYERVRFRRPVQPGDVLSAYAQVTGVRQRGANTFVSLAITLKSGDGETVFTLLQTDCFEDRSDLVADT